eukprot:6541935-Pyramimonas_sp.AAC.1
MGIQVSEVQPPPSVDPARRSPPSGRPSRVSGRGSQAGSRVSGPRSGDAAEQSAVHRGLGSTEYGEWAMLAPSNPTMAATRPAGGCQGHEGDTVGGGPDDR